ncbi:MAG TPA: alcohol dehydrogenase catalytic domain-containing protein [Mycobacteriales bacterium]|nr:alcohol dehydrogenase catalytic domain-containing protein [Mycobacteriales bacterium]
MRAAVVAAPGCIEVTTLDDPTPAADEVVIEVAAAGICGTDLHIARGEHGQLPVVPGHEVTGTVVAVGAAAGRWHPGDRVAVDPNLPCRGCRECRRGRGNLCPDLRALGVTRAGGAAELMTAPASSCYAVPDSLDLAAAALAEPLACAVHGYDVLRLQPGASVLVYGAGTMGLMMVALARHVGATRVDVVEPDRTRRARAPRLGCSSAVASADDADVLDWDVVVEASGAVAAVEDGMSRVARGGTFLQFGVTAPSAQVLIRPYDVYRREITITGSMAVLHSFERALDLLSAGVVDPAAVVTSTASLENYPAALDAFARGEGLKTLVVPGPT